MCQLLGMNCASPTDFNFSFRGFARRGGDTDKHEHGWGLAVYEGSGQGVRAFHDPLPAARSSVAEFVSRYPIKTCNMMAHIRYATRGGVGLENVHPFQREMWGIQWCFAHNGDVPNFSPAGGGGGGDDDEEKKEGGAMRPSPLLGRTREAFYHPVGDTDSEAVFCAILNGLRAEFSVLPTLPVLYETIQRFCDEIINVGGGGGCGGGPSSSSSSATILNFLLGCGRYTLFAYSWPGSRPGSSVWNGLHYVVRRPPFSTASLSDVDCTVDFARETSKGDRVAVIATAPLTKDEDWKEFRRGQLLIFNMGLTYSEFYNCGEMER